MTAELEQWFPRLRGTKYRITSPAQPDYNCIAWAAGDASRWWEPDEFGLYYWPEAIPRRYTLDAFAQAFRMLGFEVCDNSVVEARWEKVAIFAGADGRPTHVARQLPDGTWTSKLGKLEDIKHPDIQDVSGEHYGEPVMILRRRIVETNPFPVEANS